MRKLTVKDAVATVALVAAGVPYVGYLIEGEMPFIQDPRGMASVGLVVADRLLRGVGSRDAHDLREGDARSARLRSG